MLWAYFDESGLHDSVTGSLTWLVIGGAIAKEEAWGKASAEWATALQDKGLKAFHMADFEARMPPFDKLSESDRRSLLNRLLEIRKAHVPHLFGITNSTGVYRGKFCKIYRPCLRDILRILLDQAAFVDKDDDISVVFASHKDVSVSTVKSYFEDFKAGNSKFADCSIASPEGSPPLQLADIVAYELSRSLRENGPDRYPLREMKKVSDIKLFLLLSARSSIASFGAANPTCDSADPQSE